jgi:hypothetical protein
MTTNIPVVKTTDKIDEFLRLGQPFKIAAKTLALNETHTEQQLDLLRDILIENDTVTTLDISCYEKNRDRPKPFTQISEILRKTKAIESLFIRGQYFVDENRKKIFTDLSHNKTIKKLVIHARLDAQGYYYLSEMLKSNPTITYITISDSDIDEASLKYLNEALKINTSLKTLILKVSVKRPELLKESIIHNTTLRLLHIHMENISKDQIDTFCGCIEQNVGLETLIVTGVSKYFVRILKSFVINSTISNLSSGNYATLLNFNPEDEEWIREIQGLTYTDAKNSLLDAILLENKMRRKKRKEDLKILLFNIARSSAALELVPIEIWQNIFRFLVYPGIFVGDLAEIIFPLAWTLDLTKKKNTTNFWGLNNNNNVRGNSNNNNAQSNSKFCALL